MELKDYSTTCTPTWCPGCGNYSIMAAFVRAAAKEGWNCHNTVLVAGIGCHGHITSFVKLNSFEGLHGRAIPAATGIKMANTKLNVFVFTGDGDCLGEGGNHFIHAARRNHDITVILHNNGLYALTTGQTSPVSPHGLKTKSTPEGNPDNPFSPVALALSAGATFVARVFADDIQMLTDIIAQANAHKGFSVIDVLQPCPSFNKLHTREFLKANIYKVGNFYDPGNKEEALKKAMEWGEKNIPVGVIYRAANSVSHETQLEQLKGEAMVHRKIGGRNVEGVLERFV